MLIQLHLKHICYGNAISNPMSDSEQDFHACFLCPTLLHQPPFFGFSEMLTTKKSASGVGSKLKWSHSGVIPGKSPKESTPGDSDSRNRCNPSLLSFGSDFLIHVMNFFKDSLIPC